MEPAGIRNLFSNPTRFTTPKKLLITSNRSVDTENSAVNKNARKTGFLIVITETA